MKLSWARVSAATLVAMGAMLLWSGPARAQTGGTGGTTTVTSLNSSDFFIGVQRKQGENLTDFDLTTYFNQANCECETPTFVYGTLNQTTGLAKRPYITRGTIQAWVGVQCDQPLLRPSQCVFLGEALLTKFAADGGIVIKSDAHSLMLGAAVISVIAGTGGTSGAGGSIGKGDVAADCHLTQQLATQTIWLLVDQDADNNFEFGASKQIPIDLTAPPALATPTVQGGNEALVASWKALTPTDDASGVLGYQVICNRADQFQVFPSGSYKPGYETASTNCPDTHPGGGNIQSLDPNFLCSELLSASATSARVKVLQNDIVYMVSVLAIDKHLNASLSPAMNGTPIPSQNFFNKYRNADTSKPGDMPDGGNDPGGFCSIDPTTTLRLSTLSALVMTVLAVAVLRRRRRRRGA